MNTNLIIYLKMLRNDIFKLLPMKEEENIGKDNHIKEYLSNLIISINGAIETYQFLKTSKKYIYIINNLNYLANSSNIPFHTWRKIILTSTNSLTNIILMLKKGEDYDKFGN